jgi:hypothetical protein
MFCINCGASIQPNFHFCEEYGSSQSATSAQVTLNRVDESKAKLKISLSLLVVALILAMFGVSAAGLFPDKYIIGVKNIASLVSPKKVISPEGERTTDEAAADAPQELDRKTQIPATKNPPPAEPHQPDNRAAAKSLISEGYITGSDVNFRQSPNGAKKIIGRS